MGPKQRYLQKQLDLYNSRYGLTTKLSFTKTKTDYGIFLPRENTIYLNDKHKKNQMLKILLHEIGHAIQFNRKVIKDVDLDSREIKNIQYVWNIECAAERFAFRQYHRFYSHLGEYLIVEPDVKIYYRNFLYLGVLNKTGLKEKTRKHLNKRYSLITSRIA